MRTENSKAYEAKMKREFAKMDRERKRDESAFKAALHMWRSRGRGWLPIDSCPFRALQYGGEVKKCIMVSDGKDRALVSVKTRFGTPIFWEKEPEEVWKDGMLHLVGGVEKKIKRPKWWYKWELVDEFGSMNYAGGEEIGKDEIGFLPTMWTFLPEPPNA